MLWFGKGSEHGDFGVGNVETEEADNRASHGGLACECAEGSKGCIGACIPVMF